MLVFARCARTFSDTYSKLFLLPVTDNKLSNDIGFVYVRLGVLELWPKNLRFALFFVRAALALRTRNKSYCPPLTITLLMISVSSMYVEAFLSYEPKTHFVLAFVRCARIFCPTYLKLVLLPSTDHYLFRDISFVYVRWSVLELPGDPKIICIIQGLIT